MNPNEKDLFCVDLITLTLYSGVDGRLQSTVDLD
jgi:hypothetical protein